MNEAYLLIGGNLGNREEYLHKAKLAITQHCGLISRYSPIYETAAWGLQHQDAFLNQVLCVSTKMAPTRLLQRILQIEESLGRIRNMKYGPRTIDIDILLYNEDVIHTTGLTIPHPHMPERRFVLQCLADVAGDYIHPVLHKTILQLLQECKDPLAVNKYN